MRELVRGLWLALLCGAVSGAVAGIAEGWIGAGDAAGAAILYAAGLLIPCGAAVMGTLTLLVWLLPPPVRNADWKRILTTPNAGLTGGVISFGLFSLLALALFYRVSVFFTTHFHHMGLASFALLCTLMLLLVLLTLLGVRAAMGIRFLLCRFQRENSRLALPWLGLSGVAAVWLLALMVGYHTGNGGSGGLFAFISLLKLDGLGAGPLYTMGVVGVIGVSLFFLLRRFCWPAIWVAAAVVVLSVGSVVVAYRVSASDPVMVEGVNGAGGLAMLSGKLIRKAGDGDGDGHSRWFGGRDCDDQNGNIHPGAQEIPDNGIDEDCSGADLNLKQLAERVGQAASDEDVDLKRPEIPDDVSVLLITVDALRADAVGLLGQQRPITPNIDEMFKNGVVYENAYSVSSYTSQSIPAMMTGKYPSELHRSNQQKLRIGLDETFAAEVICTDEVRCGGLMSHFLFKPFYGWNQGFQYWDFVSGEPKDAENTAKQFTSPDVARIAINWMKDPANTGGRFFMWVHFMDPHGDYLTHEGFKQFGPSRRDGYDHEVLFTDFYVGKVLSKFRELGLDKRTVVILTADHGESFNEHGRWLHGYELYEENIRIPLAITGPGVPSIRIDRPTSAIHLYATLLDLFGKSEPKTAHSISLLPDWVAGQRLKMPYIFTDLRPNELYESRRTFTMDGWKLHILEQSGKVRFFNLKEGEKESLETRFPAEFARVKDAYDLFAATQLHPIPPVEFEDGPLSKMPLPEP